MHKTSFTMVSLALCSTIAIASVATAATQVGGALSPLGIRTVFSDKDDEPLFLVQPGTNEIICCVKKHKGCYVVLPSGSGAILRHYKRPEFSKAPFVFEDSPVWRNSRASSAWASYQGLRDTLLDMRAFEADFGAEIAEIAGERYRRLTNDVASVAATFNGEDLSKDHGGYDTKFMAIQEEVRRQSLAERCRKKLREMDAFRSSHAATCAMTATDAKSILDALDVIWLNGAGRSPRAVKTLEARLIGYSDAILAKLLAKPRIPFDVLFEQRAWMYASGELGDSSKAQNQVQPTKKQVFDIIVGKMNLVDRNVMLDLALGSYEGDEMVAQWAVDNLDDVELKTVVQKGEVENAAFKAVRQIRADAHLADFSLDRSIPRKYREAAVARILGRESAGNLCREIYLNAEESWLAAKALAKLDGNVLRQKEFVDKSLSWFRSADGALDDRAKAYLAIPSNEDLSQPSDQHILCTMLVDSVERSRVFDKIVQDGSLTSRSEIRKLAAGDYDVDKKVALWAVDRLGDEDLIFVIGKASLPDVVFKSVRNIRSQDSIAKVATGDFGIVARIGAIDRLERESEGVLQMIAKSNDVNFRSAALKRMKTLGLSTVVAEEFIRKDNAVKEAERTREHEKRDAAIKAAKHDVELAKNDETIRRYVSAVKESLAVGSPLAFKGVVVSVTSKNWKPKIRISVKGANEAIEVLGLVPGKFDLPVAVGSRVVISGKFKSGTLAEVVLSDADVSLDREAE